MVLKNSDIAVNTEYHNSLEIAIQYELMTTKISPMRMALTVIFLLLIFDIACIYLKLLL